MVRLWFHGKRVYRLPISGTVSELFSVALTAALRTVFGSEFHTAGAEHRKARFANVVVVDG